MNRQLLLSLFLSGLLVSSCSINKDTDTTSATENNGEVLPFAALPMESVTKARLQDSNMKWPDEPNRLPADAPNVLIVLLDDVGFGISETMGGEIHTPNFTKIAKEGLLYNTFHTTSICSPTRAALLTGRNHTRVSSGTIAERAVAFDGYTGIIPKTAATIPEILKEYGYHTSAFGKWHNTPATETTMMGPKNHWPNAYGFEHFYGFLGGETSQWEPRLTENYDHIEPPQDEDYHLTEDLVKQALKWVDNSQAFSPDKPFFMYWAPGGVHGPHHVAQEWADKYKGKFDDGWDAYRERVFKRQLEMGIIPEGTELTPRDSTLQGWDDIPEGQRAFQRRLMEVFAGFVEHTDAQVGKLVDGLEERGLKENTIIIYIFGDNGSSAEGQQGSISELLAQNNIPNTVEQQIAALGKIGGIEVLGSPHTDNMYHAGWAWAGGTPFKGTKLMGSYFGGTRNPMAISWPKKIKPDGEIRTQFHHVIDIAPTLYDLLDITHPKVVHGYDQMQMDGQSLAYTFDQASAPSEKEVQFFDNNASRAIYKDGWMASTFGPFIPWNTPASVKRVNNWDMDNDVWELYKLDEDFSQAHNLAKDNPEKLEQLKKDFLALAEDNKDFPIGAGLWLRNHPADIRKTSYREWNFKQDTRRMPEFTAPGIGRESNEVTVDMEVGSGANGVIYAVGGAGGGVTLFMENGYLVYEYNMLLIENYSVKGKTAIPAGKHKLGITTTVKGPGQPGTVQITLDGHDYASVDLVRTVPLAFTATETFDVGVDLGSPVSLAYFNKRPFEFVGKINSVNVKLK
ncbi:arylsulfatase [Algoriphagus chordae]|uniref:Arylsulfatase n=1 Tax=Algoriphagus chordae TaxID=237019 RepID=A0A2W7QXX2_9BACT|nr:arylsulfatase [Algoriphagus chordae]PZX48537.1 arylsulfatase [Algoriphagus chordae]